MSLEVVPLVFVCSELTLIKLTPPLEIIRAMFFILKVLRRKSLEEKVLVVARERDGHSCEDRVIVTSIVIWDGVDKGKASCLYQRLTSSLSEHATMVTRRCGANETYVCLR